MPLRPPLWETLPHLNSYLGASYPFPVERLRFPSQILFIASSRLDVASAE